MQVNENKAWTGRKTWGGTEKPPEACILNEIPTPETSCPDIVPRGSRNLGASQVGGQAGLRESFYYFTIMFYPATVFLRKNHLTIMGEQQVMDLPPMMFLRESPYDAGITEGGR